MRKFIAFFLSMSVIAATTTACTGGEAETPETSDKPEITDEIEKEEENGEDTAVDKVLDYEIDPSKPMIALTFDDGPNTTTTNQVLDLLQKYQVRASFFLIGDNITDASAETVKRAYDMGCEIDNHSKSHPYMNEMTAEEIAAEVQFVTDKVEEITGQPTLFFRPPYIAVSDTMYQNIDMPFINGAGCNDWDPSVDVDARVKKIQRQARDGVIILLHDAEGNDQTVEALDILIPDLLEKGFQFVTVKELFEAKGVAISAEDTNLYTTVEAAN